MKYNLNREKIQKKVGIIGTFRALAPLLLTEKKRLSLAMIAIIINSALTLIAPIIIGFTIDNYIITKQFHGVIVFSGILLVVYLGGLVSSYYQTKLMGTVGQHALFNMRNSIFNKLQSLPISFFNQNKAGDLISRINNDTDKLNNFLSQSLVQFIGSVFIMTGAGIFLIFINWELGIIALFPALLIFIFTSIVSPWVKKTNANNLKSIGGLSSEIQESIENFKVVVAFNRRDYFRTRFSDANERSYKTAVKAGIANNIFPPVYGLASNIAQVLVLAFGVYFISTGNFTLGLLVSFLSYTTNFYTPLRQIAVVWANFQVAMAGWDRISDILALDSDLELIETDEKPTNSDSLLEFHHVDFVYPEGTEVLRNAHFVLEKGKTYALVGPTGGGKTTTASLMARLFDPTKGTVLLHGKDLRSYSSVERTKRIGFILQEPFLFAGTVGENILYGNSDYSGYTNEQISKLILSAGLADLINRFDNGLDTVVSTGAESISLGQKQLIAFIRAVLRKPDILILDEATANIDTISEALLQSILEKLPKETTRVVIAHRLHTIEKADEIFFVNGTKVVPAGSIDHAMDMLMHGK